MLMLPIFNLMYKLDKNLFMKLFNLKMYVSQVEKLKANNNQFLIFNIRVRQKNWDIPTKNFDT